MTRPFLYRHNTWRGAFVDLWTSAHAISGIVLAYAAMQISIEFGTAFWMTLSIGFGWELLERVTHLSRTEAFANSFSDIAAAQLGFVAGWWVFNNFQDSSVALVMILGLGIIFTLVCFFGYRAFKYYG